MSRSPEEATDLCRDLNRIAEWLGGVASDGSDTSLAHSPELVVLAGNQVIPTLEFALDSASRLDAPLLLTGGFGHATRFLYENLAASHYAPLIEEGYLTAQMGEAELYGEIAGRVFRIPEARILTETQSTNGGENARYSIHLMNVRGLVAPNLVVCQDPLMLRRTVLTWRAEGERAGMTMRIRGGAGFVPRVEPGPDGTPQLIAEHAGGTWTFPRFLGLLLGEVARLNDDEDGYGPRGKNFIAHVEIPSEVWSAYHRLLASPLAAMAAR
ncbi:YdcF family protein [Acidobacteria bacterium AB60]|nr:YdcF family protein [Acidobacteria bacterium AB60]